MTSPKSQFGPLKIKRTFEEVSNKIKEMIFDGDLKPGQKLPSENQLAEMFQVGRQSVREALRLLELSGFITIQRGVNGGPVIKNTMLNKISHMYMDAFKFNRISISDVTLARSEIEKSVILLVFEHADETDIKTLRDNIAQARKRQKRGSIAFEENIEFHRLLARASKNHVFIIVMESLLLALSNLRLSGLSGLNTKANSGSLRRSSRITEFHENILEAIEAGDKELSLKILEENLKEVEYILIENLGNSN